jgi:hypothetical protein
MAMRPGDNGEGEALELTLATGEVFRLGKTTVTRIF